MKYVFNIAVFCLIGHFAFAQNNLNATKFIDDFVVEKNTHDVLFISKMLGSSNAPSKTDVRKDLYYQDSIGMEAITNMRKDLQHHTNVFRGIRQDSVVYVNSEGKRSVLAMDDANALALNTDPQKGSHFRIERIEADSLVITEKERTYLYAEIKKMEHYSWGKGQFTNLSLITADTIKKTFANVRNDGWNTLNKKGIYKIYTFSIPIFLRNDTFCFFYYGYGCGWLCGEGQFAVYKKEKGKWVKFTTLSSWVS
jgi:hypothetical protein